MAVGKPVFAVIALLVLSALIAAWMLRLNIVPVEGSVIVHDRWTGHVDACNARDCVRLFPSAGL